LLLRAHHPAHPSARRSKVAAGLRPRRVGDPNHSNPEPPRPRP